MRWIWQPFSKAWIVETLRDWRAGRLYQQLHERPLYFPSINLTKIIRIESDLMVLEKGGAWRHRITKGADVLTGTTWPDQIV